jgi:DNA-binding PadR family transcriptional regulator
MPDPKDLTRRLENPGFEVLKKIQEGLSITEISKYRAVSRQAIYDILSSLFKKGWITRIAKGNYDLTSGGIQALHGFVRLRYNLRQHNINFKISILESHKNWEKKRHKITQLPYFNKRIKLKNNEQELFNFGRIQIRTTTKSVIIKIPTIYTKTTEEAVIQSIDCLYNAIPKIEKLFSIRLIKDYKANITIISQEYASINDSLAKIYRKEGNQLYVTDEQGKVWMITDFSFSQDETEFISQERSIDDTDAIMPMLNDLRRNPTTFSEVREVLSLQANIMNGIQQNQLIFDRNMKSHLEVLDKIGNGVKEQTEVMKGIKELLNSLGDEK